MTRVPKYRRIADAIRAQIESGEYPSWLPPERLLTDEYGVTRGTIKQALDVLDADGLTETVPGVGRRVRGTEDRQDAYLLIAESLRERIRGMRQGARLPTESALMADFHVSRSTARHAYQILRDEGLVTVRHGAGAFVAEH